MLDFPDVPFVVVGAGLYGAVIAHRIATELGLPVTVLERRRHIGGNCHSEVDAATGIEVHRYGSHIFHTGNERVWTFINRFSQFTNYRHRVFARHGDDVYTMPINLMTISRLYGRRLSPDQARALIADEAAGNRRREPANFEEKAKSLIGGRLYEAFVRGYTAKQWGVDPRLLPTDIISRLPVRFSFTDFYFNDPYEGMPVDGYHALFRRLLDHPRIRVLLGVDVLPGMLDGYRGHVVYSGPIDRYFGYRCGPLGWRTLDLQFETVASGDVQGAAVMNYVDREVPFTRIHEFRHLHPERHDRHDAGHSVIAREFSRAAGRDDEPYYPIATAEDRQRLAGYAALAAAETHVLFGGRLGSYRYMDMHHVIAAALQAFDDWVLPRARGYPPPSGFGFRHSE